ncbi:MAG: hypothetical protein NVSMB32_15500 [Actinomycetota bacterium]
MAQPVPPLEVLFEAAGMAVFDLPDLLALSYGGHLGFASPCCYANFVSSLDGVVAGGGVVPADLALGNRADRFVMGLLRACADAIVIGAGTLRAEPHHRWTPGAACPDAQAGYQELRHRLGAPLRPRLVVVTASGRLAEGGAALGEGDLAATSTGGAAALVGRLPAGVEVLALGEGMIELAGLLALLRERGALRVLTEGGPALFGALLKAGLIDQVFLTLSPLLVGGLPGGAGAAGETEHWRGGLAQAPLLGVRRQGDHLFLRYGRPGCAYPPVPPPPR